MKVLVVGVGMQGKAALYDLAHSEAVTEITAADVDLNALKDYVRERLPHAPILCEGVDGSDEGSLRRLMSARPDVAIDLLPVPLHPALNRAAIDAGVHVVNASYRDAELDRLAAEAQARGVTILPELGMDPGIYLISLGQAVRCLDEVEEIVSYGAGFPEPTAADNPLRYKVTWNFEGVLRSYSRPARVVRDGRTVEIPAAELFAPPNTHEIEIPGVGLLEAFPNGDALKYAEPLGIDRARLRRMERCVLRWPGHCALWKTLSDLHLLDDEPVSLDGVAVSRKRFLAAAIEPHIRYLPGERDLVVVRVEVRGKRNHRPERVVFQLVDGGDTSAGLTAMSRSVGFAASIGAQLVGRGVIRRRGVLSPARDVPFEPFVEALTQRGLCLERP
jgi:saccharopine dehydrogenase-like NADP-dependent oxidoreductase